MQKPIAVLGTVALAVVLVRAATRDNDGRIRAARKRIAKRRKAIDRTGRLARKAVEARRKRSAAIAAGAALTAKRAKDQLGA